MFKLEKTIYLFFWIKNKSNRFNYLTLVSITGFIKKATMAQIKNIKVSITINPNLFALQNLTNSFGDW